MLNVITTLLLMAIGFILMFASIQAYSFDKEEATYVNMCGLLLYTIGLITLLQ